MTPDAMTPDATAPDATTPNATTAHATRAASTGANSAYRFAAAALCAVFAIAAPSVVWAQGLGGPASGLINRPTARSAPEKPALAAPESLPGARAREPAAPATRLASDMQPTEALFDAINRGDIASARDALNRGADLNGVNVLGMTPMELSVDLGRNDISFLLLSMRGEDTGRGSRAAGREAVSPPPVTKTSAVAKSRPGAPSKPVAAERMPAAKQVAKPKLFANDGGAPLPSAGFLGFDSRSTN